MSRDNLDGIDLVNIYCFITVDLANPSEECYILATIEQPQAAHLSRKVEGPAR